MSFGVNNHKALRKHGKFDQMPWMILGLVSYMPVGANDHKVLRKHGKFDQMPWMIPGLAGGSALGRQVGTAQGAAPARGGAVTRICLFSFT